MRAQFKNILFLSTLLVLISVRAQAAAVIVDDADGDGIGDVCEPVNMVPVYYIMLLL